MEDLQNLQESLKIDYKRKRANARRIFKESRKKSWESFITSINSYTPPGIVWQKINAINGQKSKKQTIVLKNNDRQLSGDPKNNSELLASAFAANSSSNNYSQEFLSFKNQIEENNNVFDFLDNSNSINQNITIHELYFYLHQLKHSSPGPDNISNTLIKNLPLVALERLLDIYNFIWLNQVFPDKWREAIVIPIPKPGKLPTLTSSYRPISLTCNLCKLLEKIVSNRLRWYLEQNQLISAVQFGFRQYKSTLDHLAYLENEILTSFAIKNKVVAVSLDLEKAYEMVWKHRVLLLLEQMSIKGNTLAFVRNFLENRRIRVKIDGIVSDPINTENGLPQGSVVSVILFLVSINSVTEVIERPVKGCLFADDLTLVCSGNSIKPTQTLLQNTLDKLSEWCRHTGFKFSDTKTEFIVLAKRKKKETVSLTINNKQIKEVRHLKILGLIFDQKLNWVDHIKKLKSDCYNRLNVIKILSGSSWGSDSTCIKNTYKALIRQKIDYGSIIYDSASSNILKTLESIHNTSLRLSLGAFRTSPINSILVEAEEMPLAFRRKELCLSYAINHITNNKDSFILKDPVPSDIEFRLQPTLSPPLRLRIKKYLAEINLDFPPVFPRKHHYYPPWHQSNFTINMEIAQNNPRDTTSDYIYKDIFYEIKNNHLDFKMYYTDGSVCEGRSGCAIVSENYSCKNRLQDYTSIFTCEAVAILECLNIIKTNTNYKKYIVFTDSMSTLMALSNNHNKNPLIILIKEILTGLIDNNYIIKLIWIPSHQGISGNERADTEAKRATKLAQCNYLTSNIQDLKKHIKWKIKTLWNSYWVKDNKSALYDIRKSVFERRNFQINNRKDQVVLNRLRIGHCNITHIHLITKEEIKKCSRCDSNISIKHLLTECPMFNAERHTSALPMCLFDCLNINVKCTLKFLKIIDYHRLI